MEGDIKVNTFKIKNKVMVYFRGRMEENMKGNGEKGNRMGKEFKFFQMERGSGQFGKREKR